MTEQLKSGTVTTLPTRPRHHFATLDGTQMQRDPRSSHIPIQYSKAGAFMVERESTLHARDVRCHHPSQDGHGLRGAGLPARSSGVVW